MQRWLIKIKGKQSDLEDLPLLLTSSDLTVTREGGEFFLQAEYLNRIDDEATMIRQAEDLLHIISAAAPLHFQGFTALEIGGVLCLDDRGVRTESLMPATGLSAKWLGAPEDDGTFIPANRSKNVEHLVNLSIKFGDVAKALQFLRENTGGSLYKIYEIIAKDLGGKKEIIKARLAGMKELNRFTGSVQNPD